MSRSRGRIVLRARTAEPEDGVPTTRFGGGLSYSVRICGHCRKPAESDGAGGVRCPSCGRTRGWL